MLRRLLTSALATGVIAGGAVHGRGRACTRRRSSSRAPRGRARSRSCRRRPCSSSRRSCRPSSRSRRAASSPTTSAPASWRRSRRKATKCACSTPDEVGADPELQELVLDASRRYSEMLTQLRTAPAAADRKRRYEAGDEMRLLASKLGVDAVGFAEIQIFAAAAGASAVSILTGFGASGSSTLISVSVIDGATANIEAFFVPPVLRRGSIAGYDAIMADPAGTDRRADGGHAARPAAGRCRGARDQPKATKTYCPTSRICSKISARRSRRDRPLPRARGRGSVFVDAKNHRAYALGRRRAAVSHAGGAAVGAWLDSAAADSRDRFDILVADPYVTLRTRGATTRDRARATARRAVRSARRSSSCASSSATSCRSSRACRSPAAPSATSATTWAGGSSASRRSRRPTSRCRISPSALYDWAVVVDHAARRTWLVGNGRDERTFARWPRARRALVGRAAARAAAVSRAAARRSSISSRSAYAAAFRAVQEHIRRGDCYQVNLTQRFEARSRGRRVARVRASARDQSGAVRGVSRFAGRQDRVLVARAVPARARRPRRDEADQGHAAALEGSGARPRARRRAAHEREGSRRERHDRRSACATTWASAACRAPCARASCSTSSRSRACTSS